MEKVTAYISTAGRYHTTLPLAITALCMQTYKPEYFILFDDGEQQDLRKDPMYQYLFGLLDEKKIKWSVGFGARQGQVKNHQKALEEAKTEWLWRLDDDNIPEPDCLETLMNNVTDKVGAVAGLVLHPNQPIKQLPSWYSHNKIEYCEDPQQLNIQWFKQSGVKSVDHLYSTFIYRKAASQHGFNMDLSPVGHREESLFTYGMKLAGWDLLVDPKAVTWHFRYSAGGIRGQHHTKENFDHDAQIFLSKLYENKVLLKTKKLIVLDSGLGDHLAFRHVLPELKEKYPNLVLSVCYPEVFKDDGVELTSIAEANCDIAEHNIYKWMWDRDWKNTIVEAYRQRYV